MIEQLIFKVTYELLAKLYLLRGYVTCKNGVRDLKSSRFHERFQRFCGRFQCPYMARRARELLQWVWYTYFNDIHDDLMIFITTLTGVKFKIYFVRFQDFKKFQDFTKISRFHRDFRDFNKDFRSGVRDFNELRTPRLFSSLAANIYANIIF